METAHGRIHLSRKATFKQECIAVGCVPPAVVAIWVGEGVCLARGDVHPPPLWADTSENNLSATTVADGNNSKHRTEVALADQEGG